MKKPYRLNWEETIRINCNNIDLAKEIITIFSDELPALAENIKDGWQKKDHNVVAQYSHKIRGSCCYCRTERLMELATQVEENIEQHHCMPPESLMNDLITEISHIINELNEREFN